MRDWFCQLLMSSLYSTQTNSLHYYTDWKSECFVPVSNQIDENWILVNPPSQPQLTTIRKHFAFKKGTVSLVCPIFIQYVFNLFFPFQWPTCRFPHQKNKARIQLTQHRRPRVRNLQVVSTRLDWRRLGTSRLSFVL